MSLTGAQTDPTALAGLKKVMGDGAVFIALIAGIAAVFTAFVSQGIIFKKTLIYDMGFKNWQALVFTCFTPVILS